MNENIWETKTERHMIVEPSGAWYRVEEKRTPIDPEPVFADIIKAQGVLSPLMGPGTFAYLKGPEVLVMQVIKTMPFRSRMLIDNKSTKESDKKRVVFAPDFLDGAGIKIEPPFQFTPPDTMRLVFASAVALRECYLLAQDTRTGQCWHPNIPNIYTNGKVCMGGAPTPEYKPWLGLDAFLKEHYKEWTNADFSYDLVEEAGVKLMEFLKFDEKTKQNIPSKEDWTTFSYGKIGLNATLTDAFSKLHDVYGGNTGEKDA